jgi:hypothetical protein
MIEPLRFSFSVGCPADHSFEVWTARTSKWWPKTSSISQSGGLEVIFEGRSGGRIFERTPAGQEIEWGEITVWEPPRWLGYPVAHRHGSRERNAGRDHVLRPGRRDDPGEHRASRLGEAGRLGGHAPALYRRMHPQLTASEPRSRSFWSYLAST